MTEPFEVSYRFIPGWASARSAKEQAGELERELREIEEKIRKADLEERSRIKHGREVDRQPPESPEAARAAALEAIDAASREVAAAEPQDMVSRLKRWMRGT